MLMKAIVVSVLFASTSSLYACRWDRDTLVHEATGMPDVIEATTGRFARNPPLYYRMRIDRESKEVTAHPDRLDLYDDIGVAYDSVGDDDSAMVYMLKKAQRMGDLRRAKTVNSKRDAFSEAAYRFYANMGTFMFHQWVRHGAKVQDIEPAEHACDLIVRALEINPDAHFGREVVQLEAMRWMIGRKLGTETRSLGESLEYINDKVKPTNEVRETLRNKNIKGLIGLIVLGNAWESPDAFEALASEIDSAKQRPTKIGMFVSLREKELRDMGSVSISPRNGLFPDESSHYPDADRIKSEYARLRTESDRWQSERTDFMMARLKMGRHPDTDPHFWDGYVSRPAPKIEYGLLDTIRTSDIVIWLINGCFLTCVIIPILLAVRFFVRKLNRAK